MYSVNFYVKHFLIITLDKTLINFTHFLGNLIATNLVVCLQNEFEPTQTKLQKFRPMIHNKSDE